MKTDRELLELAARAAGYEFKFITLVDGSEHPFVKRGELWVDWLPLTDDGDALRLAVKLGFTVEPGKCWHSPYGPAFGEDLLDGDLKATRRAIVRAAAAIGDGLAPFPTAEQIREDWT